jgi:hypothetical protein
MQTFSLHCREPPQWAKAEVMPKTGTMKWRPSIEPRPHPSYGGPTFVEAAIEGDLNLEPDHSPYRRTRYARFFAKSRDHRASTSFIFRASSSGVRICF